MQRSSASIPPFEQTVAELGRSPIFQLSLASKELFHSNFLAWLCEQYPTLLGPFFSTYLPSPPASIHALEVKREQKNIDLTITFRPGGETLIVENKVKSLPELPQLAKYASHIKSNASVGCLLLSLVRPSFLPAEAAAIAAGDGVSWHYLRYCEFAERLRRNILPEVARTSAYHGALLGDYIGFVTRLDALQAAFALNWDDSHGNFFEAEEKLKRVRTIRLHDLFDKLRYAQLAEQVAKTLKDDGFMVTFDAFPIGEQDEVALSAGMTRSVGLFDAKYLVTNIKEEPVYLGVQVQGKHFRLNVEMRRGLQVQRIAEALLRPTSGQKVWFDFNHVPSSLGEYPPDGFNKYGNVFFYRSKKLGSISPPHLVDAIVSYIRLVRTKRAKLREQIESAG
jgi:hypothetical protein